MVAWGFGGLGDFDFGVGVGVGVLGAEMRVLRFEDFGVMIPCWGCDVVVLGEAFAGGDSLLGIW